MNNIISTIIIILSIIAIIFGYYHNNKLEIKFTGRKTKKPVAIGLFAIAITVTLKNLNLIDIILIDEILFQTNRIFFILFPIIALYVLPVGLIIISIHFYQIKKLLAKDYSEANDFSIQIDFSDADSKYYDILKDRLESLSIISSFNEPVKNKMIDDNLLLKHQRDELVFNNEYIFELNFLDVRGKLISTGYGEFDIFIIHFESVLNSLIEINKGLIRFFNSLNKNTRKMFELNQRADLLKDIDIVFNVARLENERFLQIRGIVVKLTENERYSKKIAFARVKSMYKEKMINFNQRTKYVMQLTEIAEKLNTYKIGTVRSFVSVAEDLSISVDYLDFIIPDLIDYFDLGDQFKVKDRIFSIDQLTRTHITGVGDVKICCKYAARLGNSYCECGLAISRELIDYFNS